MKMLSSLVICMTVSLVQAVPTPDPTAREVWRLIRRHRVQYLEDLLPRLPETYRSHYVLMRKSESLQEALPQFPRVFFFGRTARLLLSFGSGHPFLKGFDSLEAIDFDDSEKEFAFYVFLFAEPLTRMSALLPLMSHIVPPAASK